MAMQFIILIDSSRHFTKPFKNSIKNTKTSKMLLK